MKCPKCDAPMEKVEYHSIEVDRCTNCKGLWLDRSEKEQLKKMKGSEAIDVGDPKKGAEYNEIEQIECPVCTTQMVRMVDVKQPHIWYESCPICYGVFFDAGEFRDYKEESILDFFRDLTTPPRD